MVTTAEIVFSNSIQSIVRDFRIDDMMRYSLFVPRLYNLCLSLGFEVGNIMPSRAFCSDENQGFPIILITKHFGAFPFDHGRVGGIMATDRHAPHADHGRDMVIIQASHVGYDPDTESFGSYRRLQTADNKKTVTCGKIGAAVQWYLDEYRTAQNNIHLGRDGEVRTITIDNHLLDPRRSEGLFLELDRMVLMVDGKRQLLRTMSTSRSYVASDDLCKMLPEEVWVTGQPAPIAAHLGPELFVFRRDITGDDEGHNHIESHLIDPMPWIVTSPQPLLVAAKVNTQAEFDRTFRTIVKAREYHGKRLLFISCLNIDISPQEGQLFPLTKCVPWAAYIQNEDGSAYTLEQPEVIETLLQQSSDNPHQIDLEAAIQRMVDAAEIRIAI